MQIRCATHRVSGGQALKAQRGSSIAQPLGRSAPRWRCSTPKLNVSNRAFSKLFGGWLGSQPDRAGDGGQQEDLSTMRKLDEDSEQGVDGGETAFGPAATLMIGFSAEELEGFRTMMLSMEADMFKIIPCTRAMLDGTLQAALEADCPAWEQPALGTRRVIVLSGMFGGEVVEVVSAYRESGLPPAVFCCAVPKNMDRDLRGLAAEVAAEDTAMRQMAAKRAAERRQQEEEEEDEA